MFGTVPLLILLYLLNSDSDNVDTGFDLSDGFASLDGNGLRIDFPDGSYARWVEPISGTAHWRTYG